MKNYIILGASTIIGLALHGYITRANYQISSFLGDSGRAGAYRTNLRTGEMDMYFYNLRYGGKYLHRVIYLPPEIQDVGGKVNSTGKTGSSVEQNGSD